jgi:hypothetical protein
MTACISIVLEVSKIKIKQLSEIVEILKTGKEEKVV